MRKIRIGNDIAVQWSLVAKGTGEPFVVEGKDIRLSLKSIFAKTAINEFDVAGNTISWTFKGAEQKQVGIYSLEVSLLDEQGVMITTDVCDFVELVACSCEIGGMDATGVHTESIELISDVDVAAGIDLSAYLTKTEAQTTYQPQEKGKGLSTNDYTTAEKNKLDGLQNYDDTEIRQGLTELSEEIEHQSIFIEDLQNTKIDRENDDYYPKMAVGLADNLAGVDVVDSEINFRRSGGGAISDGVARIETIKGNSVVWNQVINADDYRTYSSTITRDSDGWYNVMASAQYGRIVFNIQNLITNHQYLISYEIVKDSFGMSVYFDDGFYPHVVETSNALNGVYRKIVTYTAKGSPRFIFQDNSASGWTSWKLRNVQIIDLTKMFGAGNEPTTIEEFYQRIPQNIDINAYNEGEVIHMDVQSIESQGVNQWDEQWELGKLNSTGVPSPDDTRIRTKNFTRVIPNETYYFHGVFGYGIFFYDADKNYVTTLYVNNNKLQIPSNAMYLKFNFPTDYGTTYNHDICINLSDTYINGKYFPYVKRTEDLSIIRKYFPDGMKSAGTAHDEIRYNKASGKWEKVVRIGEVDLGTLKWQIENTEGSTDIRFLSQALDNIKTVPSGEQANILCTKYGSVRAVDTYKAIQGVAVKADAKISIYDSSYTDVAALKASLQGVILYYELAEPIVTELDAEDQFKDFDYQVWNCGTEKTIAEGKSAPLAADITYGFNAIGKIKELESLVAALRAKVGI